MWYCFQPLYLKEKKIEEEEEEEEEFALVIQWFLYAKKKKVYLLLWRGHMGLSSYGSQFSHHYGFWTSDSGETLLARWTYVAFYFITMML